MDSFPGPSVESMREARAVALDLETRPSVPWVDKSAAAQAEYERICYGGPNVDPC